MASQTTKLSIDTRETGSSRATRRLRREGLVPGVLYGGGDEPLAFAVDKRELRHALAARGAVVELQIDGSATSAVLKDSQIHPVRGETLHVDFLRVDLRQAISATVPLEFVGAEDAPGAREGGVLEYVTREVTIEALPNDIPQAIQVDVSGMAVNDTLLLSSVTPPDGVTLTLEGNNRVIVSGSDKELVGETAARIRRIRPPEPYKGKGIKYAEETIRRKAGKAGAKGKK